MRLLQQIPKLLQRVSVGQVLSLSMNIFFAGSNNQAIADVVPAIITENNAANTLHKRFFT